MQLFIVCEATRMQLLKRRFLNYKYIYEKINIHSIDAWIVLKDTGLTAKLMTGGFRLQLETGVSSTFRHHESYI